MEKILFIQVILVFDKVPKLWQLYINTDPQQRPQVFYPTPRISIQLGSAIRTYIMGYFLSFMSLALVEKLDYIYTKLLMTVQRYMFLL